MATGGGRYSPSSDSDSDSEQERERVKVAVLLGNERTGLTIGEMKWASHSVCISTAPPPRSNYTELSQSLNLSHAAAVLFHNIFEECTRVQRRCKAAEASSGRAGMEKQGDNDADDDDDDDDDDSQPTRRGKRERTKDKGLLKVQERTELRTMLASTRRTVSIKPLSATEDDRLVRRREGERERERERERVCMCT